MNGRTYAERQNLRRARAETGYTSLRISNATRELLGELSRIIQPYELRGLDELVAELAAAELARRKRDAA